MATKNFEKVYSRSTTWSAGIPAQTRMYVLTDCVTGENAGKDVPKRVAKLAPQSIKISNIVIPRADISYVRVGVEQWEATVQYGIGGGSAVQFGLKFNAGGGTASATQAFPKSSDEEGDEAIFKNTYWTKEGQEKGGSFHGNALNVDEKGNPQPVTVKKSMFSFSWSFTFPTLYAVDYPAILTVGKLTGMVNGTELPFDPRYPDILKFPAGSVLFEGLSGNSSTESSWTLDLKFSYQPPQKIEKIAGIKVGREKPGFQYQWMEYSKAPTGKQGSATAPIDNEVVPKAIHWSIIYQTAYFFPITDLAKKYLT